MVERIPAARNRALLSWYATHRRALPWRGSRDPWLVLVSEVMLQQTQVDRVVPVFERFVTRFPTPESLAEAGLAEVIELWGSLGYQRRAVNLAKAAEVISRGGWPTDPAGLAELPGVGPYTAAAVACFAFGYPAAAVDTNLRRVLSRWEGAVLDGARLRDRATDLIDRGDPAAWNQAVMDLGALVCRPARPHCDRCPVRRWCAAPDVTPPRTRQSRYQGSRRQARAAVLRLLARTGAVAEAELAARVGLQAATVAEAVGRLLSEGLIRRSADGLVLADRPGEVGSG